MDMQRALLEKMKIKTKLTLLLLVCFLISTALFILIIGQIFKESQKSNVLVFKNELLNENAQLIDDSATLFFKLIELKIMGNNPTENILDFIKEIDQLNRSVTVFDFKGLSLLPGHSRPEFEHLLSKKIIDKKLEDLNTKNKKNFNLDNFDQFIKSKTGVIPQKIYFQIYKPQQLIIGYGRLLEEIKTRLLYLERRDKKSEQKLLIITLSILISGIFLIIFSTLVYSSKHLFNPLESLIKNFDLVAKGELYHHIDVHSDNEIGKLSHSFNNMTSNLNQSVNEIKAINIKLDNYSKKMADRVELRTKELTLAVEKLKQEIEERKQIETKLREARRESEAANKAKTQFLANMSHEIRTPMNAIIGMSELVLDTKLTLEQEEYITTLKSSAESLLGLLNDILDLSKIEVGKLDIEPIEFHFRKCLGDIAKNVFIHTQKKEIELIYDIGLDIPEKLIGDPGRLRQIITNLFGNAVKFTEKGIILLKVEIKDRIPATNYKPEEIRLHFSISDTGIGIPEEKQKLIFENFTQSDNSVTRKFGGTGLGLSISMQLVQIMGGEIWVKSPGELKDMKSGTTGSTFHFILKFQVPTPAISNEDGEFQELSMKELKGITALVVDDNLINRKIFKELLSQWEIETYLVENGARALQFLKQSAAEDKKIHLILLDVQMPMMDGFEVARQIRKDPDLKDIPIIILTSAGVKGDGKRCRKLGIAAYLRKPVPASELLETLLIVMGNVNRKKNNSKLITRYSLRETRKKIDILIVEDNRINQKLLQRMLEKRSYLTDIASHGKEALEKISQHTYDLVLMDIQMPEMDGIEATKQIRKIERENDSPKLPIIALTAHAMKGDKERFMKVGMTSYISKPIKQAELLEIIDRILYDKQPETEKNPDIN